MTSRPRSERRTQNRVIALFTDVARAEHTWRTERAALGDVGFAGVTVQCRIDRDVCAWTGACAYVGLMEEP